MRFQDFAILAILLVLAIGRIAAGQQTAETTPPLSTPYEVDTSEDPVKVQAAEPRVITATPDIQLVVGGQVTADFLFNSARPIAPGTPFFLAPSLPSGGSQNTFDANSRQTAFYALISGPRVCDSWESSAFVYANLYNDAVIVDRYGLLPIQAFGQLKNDCWRFAAGLQFDIFNPLNPTMLPFSVLTGSGNAGSGFRGQARVERYFYSTEFAQVTMTAGLSEPIATGLTPDFRLSEDNGLPNVESRIALACGALEGQGLEATRPLEFGISSVVGQIRTTSLPAGRVVADVWGLGSDARFAFTPHFGVKGEYFIGQSLGTYGGGILQNVNSSTFAPIHSQGGWGEAYYYICPNKLHTHVGYGIDSPAANDVAAGQLVRNDTIFTNLMWDVTGYFRLAGEVTYRDTVYKGLPENNGVGFQSQVQWKF